MKHFTIFQNFYYVIAEMTEEEIVSAIASSTYRKRVEEIRHIFAEQGEKAANEKKKELPAIAFSACYRGRRTKDNLVKYLGHIVIDIDHLSEEELARILPIIRGCRYTRIVFISPKGMGVKIVVRACHPDETLPETLQEIANFHHAVYTKLASLYAQLCQIEIDTSGQDVARTCLFSYDPDIYFNPDAEAFLMAQPPMSYKPSKNKSASGPKQQNHPKDNPMDEETALNSHSDNASLVLTLTYYHKPL